ncbi:MAG: hypothetical protein IH987_02455, partial [Planctomycetes bacterium]|nr:hypothetical protein [Planctomycetota bacterium]
TCIVPNPDYSVVFAVESCQIAACCVGSTCILTNELDCAAQQGIFLGSGDQPIVTCQAGACSLGSCCVNGECNDDQFHDEEAECLADGGTYIGGLTCDDDPCPACPFDSPQNCQQVQTIFGRVPIMDRNPDNYGGAADPVPAGASMHADDVKFGGSTVDQICWNTAFFTTPCCGGACTQNIDDTWEIRIYEPDPDCDAIPGAQLGVSAITVLNKIAGTGQGANNWHYSGNLNVPVSLPNGGLAGDTYWFEVTAFGDSGCEIRATWSRDHGNEHVAQTVILSENDSRVYDLKMVEEGIDLGFCENSGIATPDTVLGSCCTCPTCQNGFSFRDCDQIRGFWTACGTCADIICDTGPPNDDCDSAQVVTDVPATADGSAFTTVGGQNICAGDDGPALDDDNSDPEANNCAGSVQGDFELHDDVWYEYTATDCGDLRIHSCDTTDQDMMIAIYDGSVDCPMATGDELACDHNGCQDYFDSDVTLRVTAGKTYLVRIGGFNNEVAGGFDGDPRGTWTTQWSLTTNCPAVLPPIRAAAPHNIRKNRYISIDPRGELGNNPDSHHIRVDVESTLVADLIGTGPWWANPPVIGLPPSPATCISIVTSLKPASEPDWSGCPTLHLTGCPIIPTTIYAVAAESGGLLSVPEFLESMAVASGKWLGDCVGQFTGPPDNVWTDPNLVVNIDDAVAGIKTFINSNGFNATHLSVTDIHPVLNGAQMTLIVNINDVLLIIAGFQGKTWGEVASPAPDDEIPDLTECP